VKYKVGRVICGMFVDRLNPVCNKDGPIIVNNFDEAIELAKKHFPATTHPVMHVFAEDSDYF
jgi:hypothetical protein